MTAKRLFQYIGYFLKDRFDLEADKEDEQKTIESISKGAELRGTNLWILVFAVFVASIGLNVNSTAVVIGAMLISPLMGPIMGLGLGAGTNDLDLVKMSGKSFVWMVVVGIVTSMLYFLITPLSDAQSELLSRTTPTIWDVGIATFGGLAGIVAGSRKEKSNAIPGVAIATALMPPLCTAGYGLANGNWSYFFGAFYLFFINVVCIGLSTFVIVRFLKFQKKNYFNEATEGKVKRFIAIGAVVTIAPSIYLGYQIVVKTLFERSARLFIQREFVFPNTQTIRTAFGGEGNAKRIEVLLVGERISEFELRALHNKLVHYNIPDAELVVRQGSASADPLKTVTGEALEQIIKTGAETMREKQQEIDRLRMELRGVRQKSLPSADINREIRAHYPEIQEFSLQYMPVFSQDSTFDTVVIGVISSSPLYSKKYVHRTTEWLKARTKTEKARIIVD